MDRKILHLKEHMYQSVLKKIMIQFLLVIYSLIVEMITLYYCANLNLLFFFNRGQPDFFNSPEIAFTFPL